MFTSLESFLWDIWFNLSYVPGLKYGHENTHLERRKEGKKGIDR